MALKVFVDESGTDDRPVFIMAAYIARAEQWEAFNAEWLDVLAQELSVSAFHMQEARHAGQIEKLPQLIEVIKRNVMFRAFIAIEHNDHEENDWPLRAESR